MGEMMSMLTRPTPQTSRFVRTREAALYLAVSEKKLRQLAEAGVLHPIPRGNVELWDVHELDAYADALMRIARGDDKDKGGRDATET